jgi:hypothetical protein
MGMHAGLQSLQPWQLDVAQGSQKRPGPQSPHASPQAGTHVPVVKMQRPPSPQSSCWVQPPGPVVVEGELDVDMDVTLDPPLLDAPALLDEPVPPVPPEP